GRAWLSNTSAAATGGGRGRRPAPRRGRSRSRAAAAAAPARAPGRAGPRGCRASAARPWAADRPGFRQEPPGIPSSCYNGRMINVSETAASKITELLAEEQKGGSGLRVFVQGGGCSGFQYGLMIEENGQGAGDQVFESNGIRLFVDPISIRYLN